MGWVYSIIHKLLFSQRTRNKGLDLYMIHFYANQQKYEADLPNLRKEDDHVILKDIRTILQ